MTLERRATGTSTFTTDCQRCPRLAAYLAQNRRRHPAYFNRPVPSFGPVGSPLLLVGLAPGLHGANASGRPFTGDFAGRLLYATLHEQGFSSHRESTAADDALRLEGCRIVNAVRCVPPQNRPTPAEVRTCNAYLGEEIDAAPADAVIVALGRVAHDAVLRALGLPATARRFAHGASHTLPCGRKLIDSYHCSRYNTQTRRLTREMFVAVFQQVRAELTRRLE